MGYQLVTPSGAEPLDLDTVKLHLRVDSDDEDTLITALVVATRQFAEQETRRSLMTQQWRLVLDGFPPRCDDDGAGLCVLIERGPVQALGAIQYLDMAGATQTWAAPEYAFDPTSGLARLAPAFGKIWPIVLPQIGAVTIPFTAGYGDNASDVPEGIKQWMLLRIAGLYANREDVVTGRGVQILPVPYIDRLLDAYRVVLP